MSERNRKYLDIVTEAFSRVELRDVSDEALEQVEHRMADVSQRLRDEGSNEASWVVWALSYACRYEVTQRRWAEHNARIEMESDGHEVYVGHDANAFGPGQEGWSAFCHCSGNHLDPGYVATRAEAVEIAGLHAVKHGCGWNYDLGD